MIEQHAVSEIPFDEEMSRDCDWFAVDDDGNIGSFTTAGFRRLPDSVRRDWGHAEALIEFFDKLPEITLCSARPGFAESETGRKATVNWKNAGARKRYLCHFEQVARKGPFAYDTVLRPIGDYDGVTVPGTPPSSSRARRNSNRALEDQIDSTLQGNAEGTDGFNAGLVSTKRRASIDPPLVVGP